MTAIQDPYPPDLDDVVDYQHATALGVPPIAPNPDAVMNRLIVAVNRLATAVEQDTLARLHPVNPPNASLPPADPRLVGPQPAQNAPQGLAPLPPVVAPVQVVAGRPPCPYHGIEKVAPSTNGRGGFYCQAKPGIGQPNTNPKGYCTWHT